MNRFAGRTALVTGGANGIGAATCRRLADEGARVIVADIDDDRAAALAAQLSDATAMHHDVADPDSWDRMRDLLETGTKTFPPGLDVLVNNAYTVVVRPATELAVADWDRQLAVDLSAVFHSVRTLLPMLAQRTGAIVNVASVHAAVGYPGHPAYAAAKGGVVALTRQLATDYGADVRVNAVLPGAVDTRAWSDVPAHDREHHAQLAAMKRFGTADEVAAAVAFLASEDASYICGETLAVDGGLLSSRY